MALTYLLIRNLPTSVRRELTDSSTLAEIPVNRAVSAILRGRDLDAAIFAGQRKAADFARSRKKDLGVHIQPEDHASLKKAADGLGVKIGDAARHVLAGLAGSIPSAIKSGIGAKMRTGD